MEIVINGNNGKHTYGNKANIYNKTSNIIYM